VHSIGIRCSSCLRAFISWAWHAENESALSPSILSLELYQTHRHCLEVNNFPCIQLESVQLLRAVISCAWHAGNESALWPSFQFLILLNTVLLAKNLRFFVHSIGIRWSSCLCAVCSWAWHVEKESALWPSFLSFVEHSLKRERQAYDPEGINQVLPFHMFSCNFT